MMVSVLIFTVVGSYVSSLVPSATMGNFSVFMTFLLGIKFIIRPVMTTKEAMEGVSAKKRAIQSVVCGILIGFICGFIGAGGGMMMLLILTSVLGYELKTAVGTSVFIMTFTALTGAVSHFAIGGIPDITVWILCIVFTLIWARIAAIFANKATPETLNRATGVILVILGIVVMLSHTLDNITRLNITINAVLTQQELCFYGFFLPAVFSFKYCSEDKTYKWSTVKHLIKYCHREIHSPCLNPHTKRWFLKSIVATRLITGHIIQHMHIDIAYVINCGLSVGFITVNASSLASLPTIKNSRMKATGTIIGNSCNAAIKVVPSTVPVLRAIL